MQRMKKLLEPTTHAQLIDRLSKIQLSLASIAHTSNAVPTEEEKLTYSPVLRYIVGTLIEQQPACLVSSCQTI